MQMGLFHIRIYTGQAASRLLMLDSYKYQIKQQFFELKYITSCYHGNDAEGGEYINRGIISRDLETKTRHTYIHVHP